MKIKSLKNSVRFIDSNKNWWRIRFPKKDSPTLLQHRCEITITDRHYQVDKKLAWSVCCINKKTPGVYCLNCGLTAPDEVMAAGKLTGAELSYEKLIEDRTLNDVFMSVVYNLADKFIRTRNKILTFEAFGDSKIKGQII